MMGREHFLLLCEEKRVFANLSTIKRQSNLNIKSKQI